MSIFYYKGEDGAFHPLHALVGPPGKDGVISQIEDENGTKHASLPTLKFLNCEVTADTEKVTVSPHGGQGGSGGGHTIQDSENSNLPQRGILKFADGFQVSDDSTNGKTVVSCVGGTKNVAGYVGEISLFADNQLRENHVWADGSTIDPAQWPDLAAYAATAGWETDSGTGWYKTPNLQGCFLLPSSSEYSVNTTGGEKEHTHTYGVRYSEYYGAIVDGIAAKDYPTGTFSGVKSQATTGQHINGGLTTQKNEASPVQLLAEAQTSVEPTMPPYYVVTAQIRAKVDIIEATAMEVNGNTLGGFEDGQFLKQENGKIVGATDPTVPLLNLGKLLWTGNFSSGSITVPNIANYQIIAVILQNDICCIGTNQWGIGGFAEYGSYTNKVCGYRLAPSGNTLTIDENCKGGNVDNQQVPIIRIYGIC